MNLFGWLAPRVYRVSANTEISIKKAWESVEQALITKTPSQLRQALITADKCVDNALRDIVKGETMGERLKNAKNKFEYSVYDGIWRAHKIRNSLVHETEFEPSYSTLTQAIYDFKKALDQLGVKVK